MSEFGLGDPAVLLIGGVLRPATGGGTFETISPSTEEVLGVAADATAADMDDAIATARNAFDIDVEGWTTNASFRARCLRQLHDAFVANREALRAMTQAEVGAPIFMLDVAQFEVPVGDLNYFADLAENYDGWKVDLGEAKPLGMPTRRWVVREPAGVVGAITPWNFPHQINLAKIGPALAAGCTVVLKAAPDTPWCASILGRMIHEHTDIPAGVINIITSSDHALGAQLSSDDRVDVVSFTGSTATGRKVMTAAAENLTKVFLELGGKSAYVVLDDANISGSASMAASMACAHAGQGCAISTRLLLPRDRFDEGVAAAAATMTAIGCGDLDDAGTMCGPVISARQRDRIEGYLQLATEEGGTFAAGGGRPNDRDRGFWIEPTLITGLDNSARVAREEIFGPVLVAIPHDGDDDAVRIANDSPYGLSGSVDSADSERAWAVARRIRTGTLGVNGGIWYSGDVPFGGYKHSGIGREMGVAGFEEYLETKSIAEGV